jgi:hypothetical protein
VEDSVLVVPVDGVEAQDSPDFDTDNSETVGAEQQPSMERESKETEQVLKTVLDCPLRIWH